MNNKDASSTSLNLASGTIVSVVISCWINNAHKKKAVKQDATHGE
ncbi:MAG: hypothetical protein QN720_08040 [Nitrososphaeraceae archaeon]|nr:hypothetical protein [Nitrososphaeraceae archaeon]MDW0315941.1 hypothetical protein [Nitrososphaeraceae archaeon]MDW0332926.1 hypothetical protein [Nitrososphaeraceae archaeon]